ncbi:NAD(P)-dependent oxidoreductase [Alphaproteobacteria bacterium]|nr:NAD(P)-dependent oxidoreductase [Alphaproteobacteria bacterium]
MHAFYKGKNVLVAGGSGFVGTNLIKELLKYNCNVTATLFNKEPQIKFQNVKYIKTNLTKPDQCKLVCKDQDIVFNVSAVSSGALVIEKKPLVHLTPNVLMNTLLLEASYEAKVKKFCFTSSNTVYPVSNKPMKEEDINYQFYDKYFVVGWMKCFSEIMCQMYSNKIQNPMDIVIIRPGNLYGPFDKFNKVESKVIPALIRRALEKEKPFEVWGDGSDIKDFIYIDDFIKCLCMLIPETHFGEIYNICSGEKHTIKDILSLLRDFGYIKKQDIVFNTSMPSMIPIRLLSNSKVKNKIKWRPETDLKTGISNTIKWYKNYSDI